MFAYMRLEWCFFLRCLYERRGSFNMLPVRVVLAVQDSEYVEPLLQFIHGSEYVERVQVTAFTQMQALLQYHHKPDLIVGEVEMLEAWLSKEKSSVPWIALSEGEEVTSLMGNGLTTPKYQPLPQLLDQWISHMSGNLISRKDSGSGDTQVISIVSFLGGSGKTTVSVNMAKQLGVLGRRVFYLNLETVNSAALFPIGKRRDKEEANFSRLLYDIKSSQELNERADIPLSRYVMHHDGLKCDVFEPSDHLKDMLEMTVGDVEVIIDSLSKSGQYDVIIIDTDNLSESRLRAAMKHCNLLLWVMLDDLVSMHKTGIWLGHIEKEEPDLYAQIMNQGRFIVNRFTGSLANPMPHKDIRVDGMLPYIPSWKQVQQEELLLCSPIFQRDILKLCSELLGDIHVGSHGERAYG